MSGSSQVFGYIKNVSAKIHTAATRDERFDLLDNVSILMQVLQEVTLYERKLVTDLDID